MDNERITIGISIDSNVNLLLNKNNYNKSKLINSLIIKWLELNNLKINFDKS